MSSCGVSVCLVGYRDAEEGNFLLIFFLNILKKSNYFVLFFLLFYFIEEIIWLNYNLDVIFFLVPSCPLYYVGDKLSWCQIVRFYCVGAKLSWCQIVRCQIVLVPNCPGAKLSGVKLSGAKLSYHPIW